MNYVAGLMFSEDLSFVALIKKTKPEWQKGLLNGIGGKVEWGETSKMAMVREFAEEAAVVTDEFQWTHFLTLASNNFDVDFFHSVGNLENLKALTEEEIVITAISDIKIVDPRMIENLPWIISLALDNKSDNRPSFVTAKY